MKVLDFPLDYPGPLEWGGSQPTVDPPEEGPDARTTTDPLEGTDRRVLGACGRETDPSEGLESWS